MIQQFSELGAFYQRREDLVQGTGDPVTQYMRDPVAKFRTKTVLLLVFSEKGFERIQSEECDLSKRRAYLYREGPPNGWDATPTSGLRAVKGNSDDDYRAALLEEVRKKLVRLSDSIRDSVERSSSLLPQSEREALQAIGAWLDSATEKSETSTARLVALRDAIKQSNPPVAGKKTIASSPAIVSVAWQQRNNPLQRVGDFVAFQQSLVRSGKESATTKKGIKGIVQGKGQCSICGKASTEVSGLLQIQQFKLYTLDKPGSVSGGFDPSGAWRNFPACGECCDKVDFAGERIKRDLSFDYYGFKYLLLPSPVLRRPTMAYEFLDRLVSARLNTAAEARLTAAEGELFYVVSQEANLLQVDLLFYQPGPQSFRPALYVSGLLPTRFRKLFGAKDCADSHPWLDEPSPVSFTKGEFTFGSLRNVFPAAHGGSTFDDDFLSATRTALELRPFSTRRLLQVGMRWVQDDYRAGKAWEFRLADLFRTILFFETLTNPNTERRQQHMQVDYGDSDQAKRVCKVLDQTSGKLRTDPAPQAAFLIGACCSRIEQMQAHIRGTTPFSGKLKGFRLDQSHVRGLFVAAKDKAMAYGVEQEGKVSGLLECAAAALAATPDQWPLSPDEISYFFCLGHALRPRFAKDADETPTNQPE